MALRYCFEASHVPATLSASKKSDLAVVDTEGHEKSVREAEPDALKEFFRQAGQAVDTTHLTDSVTMLTKEGFELRHEVFLHDAPAPTEPEEVVEEQV